MMLTKGKKKNGPIVWTKEPIESFEKIKKIITEDAMLHYPPLRYIPTKATIKWEW